MRPNSSKHEMKFFFKVENLHAPSKHLFNKN